LTIYLIQHTLKVINFAKVQKLWQSVVMPREGKNIHKQFGIHNRARGDKANIPE
jgi:hypothetical protein